MCSSKVMSIIDVRWKSKMATKIAAKHVTWKYLFYYIEI